MCVLLANQLHSISFCMGESRRVERDGMESIRTVSKKIRHTQTNTDDEEKSNQPAASNSHF